MTARNLERRLRALEIGTDRRGPGRPVLDSLSDAQLERLEALAMGREKGEWTEMSELQDEDLRLISSIPVASED